MDEKDDKRAQEHGGASVVRFPQSRARPPGAVEPFKDLGYSKLASSLGVLKEQTTGHWCSQCKGIWFGYLLEAECPVCGNRNG